MHIPRLLGLILMLVAIAACGNENKGQRADMTAGQSQFLDFSSLQRPSSPNSYLIGASLSGAASDEAAPMFDASAEQLATAWRGIVEDQPRTKVSAVSDDGLQVEAEQASATFGFIDTISFRAVPVSETQSTFVAYSRSRTGYWDLGANKSRLQTWSGALQMAVDGSQ
jgi:uncharacterized protein (DUF1499 family)